MLQNTGEEQVVEDVEPEVTREKEEDLSVFAGSFAE